MDYNTPIEARDIDEVKQLCVEPNEHGCTPEFFDACTNLMQEFGQRMPENHTEALILYDWLLTQM